MTDLPRPEHLERTLNIHALSAYNTCLNSERAVGEDKDKHMHVRILGYLLLHAPSEAGRVEVVKEIQSCGEDSDKLSELGQCFIDYYIRPFKKFKRHTPASSDYPSRPSFGKEKINIKNAIKKAPKNHKDAKIQALIRDGFRCVVTTIYDYDAHRIGDISLEERKRPGFPVHTDCAHIVPEPTYFDVSSMSSSDKKDYAASVLAVLKRFSYNVENLNGEKVHRLENVMTMQKDEHDYFDRLETYFEAEGTANCYLVTYIDPSLAEWSRTITLTSTEPTALPVPSPQLLALHATCAKVAHFSGAREYIDKLDRDKDDLNVLSPGGESAHILAHALSGLMSRTIKGCPHDSYHCPEFSDFNTSSDMLMQ